MCDPYHINIIIIISHVNHHYKMSKVKNEPSPPWWQSKALTTWPPFQIGDKYCQYTRRNLEINDYKFSCKRQIFSCNGHMWLQTL